ESEVLTGVTQLTDGFVRAGEAYFSPRMRWIIFQATPPGESDYQMYVAPLHRAGAGAGAGDVMTIAATIRVTPIGSKNTCGFFSPDEKAIIFASTAGHPAAATQPAAGYQRSTGTYRWEFPAEMEIFRADGWETAVLNLPRVQTEISRSAHYPFKDPLLAQHPITSNNAYDAECAYSSNGKWIVFTSNRTGDLELFAM